VCEYTNEEINQAGEIIANVNDLLMDNIIKIEKGNENLPSITESFVDDINSTVVAKLKTLSRSYHEEIKDADCFLKLDELASSFSIKKELLALINEFLESTLLLKATSIGEKMIREIEVPFFYFKYIDFDWTK
jgi:CRISPR/Cas system CMR subunit Cmr6 (Cas7 group RAMP superfamily)